MQWLRDGMRLALLGAACWGAPSLPTPLAWALLGAALVSITFAASSRAAQLLSKVSSIAAAVVLAHVVAAGPLPTAPEWRTSPAALATVAAIVAALVAAFARIDAKSPATDDATIDAGREAKGQHREVGAAASLTVLLLALVPIGLLPLGFSLDTASIYRTLAAACVGLTAGLALSARSRPRRRPQAVAAAALVAIAALALLGTGPRAPLAPPVRQAFPSR